MRKIYLLMLTLFCAVGAWAETVITDISNLSNDKIYVLKSGRSTTTVNHYLLLGQDKGLTQEGVMHVMPYTVINFLNITNQKKS